jgi:hypothetical protein
MQNSIFGQYSKVKHALHELRPKGDASQSERRLKGDTLRSERRLKGDTSRSEQNVRSAQRGTLDFSRKTIPIKESTSVQYIGEPNWIKLVNHGEGCRCCACRENNKSKRNCQCEKCINMKPLLANKAREQGLIFL